MSFPVPVLYKALRRIELAGKSGLTAQELIDYMDMAKARSLIADLFERDFIRTTSAQILPDTRIMITSGGVKALLEYDLQMPDDGGAGEDAEDWAGRGFTRRRRGRRIAPWVLGAVVLLLLFAAIVLGAYLALETTALNWLRPFIATPLPVS